MKRTIIITGLIVLLSSIGLILFLRITSGMKQQKIDLTEVLKGKFEITVSDAGELIAEYALDIRGPNIVQNRNFRVSGIKITDMVPEGTMVRGGDYVASLDRTIFDNSLKDEITALARLQEEFDMKILDTAVSLSTLRDDIRNQVFAAEEASIVLEQSTYEPPAVQRQAQLEVDRMQRFLEQKRRIYMLRYAQSSSDLRVLKMNLERQHRKVNDLRDVLAGFTITAPADGMVLYKKDRLGAKIRSGSILNPFDPVVATLPDLSSMLSKIYISEIEINKVRPGQEVRITVDALQDKSFTGKVASIANIGEQFANSDSKVFEVLVRLEDADPALRPSMTTGNEVIIKTFDDVIYVPSGSVRAGADNIPFVYTQSGTRQVVVLGDSNEDFVIVEQGLKEGTSVYLNTPRRQEKFNLAGNELIPVIMERDNLKLTNAGINQIESELLSEEAGFHDKNRADQVSNVLQ